jgi:hypothetical protein
VINNRLEKAALTAMTTWDKALSKADGKLTMREQWEKFMDESPEGDQRRQKLLEEKGPEEVLKYIGQQLRNKELIDKLEGKNG